MKMLTHSICFNKSTITSAQKESVIQKSPHIACVLQEKDAQCMFGLVLYSLDRLYHAVERHAKATGEWQWLVFLLCFTSYFPELLLSAYVCLALYVCVLVFVRV